MLAAPVIGLEYGGFALLMAAAFAAVVAAQLRSIPVSVGLVSLVFSFTLPIEKIAWCGWVYFLMAIILRVHWFWHRRRLKGEGARS